MAVVRDSFHADAGSPGAPRLGPDFFRLPVPEGH